MGSFALWLLLNGWLLAVILAVIDRVIVYHSGSMHLPIHKLNKQLECWPGMQLVCWPGRYRMDLAATEVPKAT